MKVSILCETIQATQTISFCFDQSNIPHDTQINFQLHSWNELKNSDIKSRYQSLFDCDYLILSRWYCPDSAAQLIGSARKYVKKIFLHLDDYLFSVPKSVGISKWRYYSSEKMINSLYKTIELCDGIIASTSRLAHHIEAILPRANIHICPYYKNFDFRKCTGDNVTERIYPVIGYMGTQTHADDLDLISSDLDDLMHRNPLIRFETFGIEVPKVLLEKYSSRCSTLPKVSNYQEFQSVLSSRGWWLGLAPLVKTQFNYCKANTKFLEYIQAGIPVIASYYGPYEDTPITNYNSIDSWLCQIEQSLFSKKKRHLLYEKQLQYCLQFSDPILLVDFYKSLLN